MPLIHFTDIIWETDGEDIVLPSHTWRHVDDDLDLNEYGAEYLTDIYGWLIKSFNFEIIQA